MVKWVGNRFGPDIKVLPNQKVESSVYDFEDVYFIQNSNSWPDLGQIAYFTIISGPYDEVGLVINLNEQPNNAYRFQANSTYVIRFAEAWSSQWDLTGGGGKGGQGSPWPGPPAGEPGPSLAGQPVSLSIPTFTLTAGGGTGGNGGPYNSTWGSPGQPGNGGSTSSSGTFPPIGQAVPYAGNSASGGGDGGTPNYNGQPGGTAPSRYGGGIIPPSFNGYAAGGSSPGLGGGGGGGGGAYWKVEDLVTIPNQDYTITVGDKAAALIYIDTPT